jgi:hypothetical protein
LMGVTVLGSFPTMAARRTGESAMVFLSAFRVGDRAGAIPGILMSLGVSLQEARLRVKDATIGRGRVGPIRVVTASVVCRPDSSRDALPSP